MKSINTLALLRATGIISMFVIGCGSGSSDTSTATTTRTAVCLKADNTSGACSATDIGTSSGTDTTTGTNTGTGTVSTTNTDTVTSTNTVTTSVTVIGTNTNTNTGTVTSTGTGTGYTTLPGSQTTCDPTLDPSYPAAGGPLSNSQIGGTYQLTYNGQPWILNITVYPTGDTVGCGTLQADVANPLATSVTHWIGVSTKNCIYWIPTITSNPTGAPSISGTGVTISGTQITVTNSNPVTSSSSPVTTKIAACPSNG